MRLFVCVFVFQLSASMVFADTDKKEGLQIIKTSGSASISCLSSALSYADVALCKSMIYPPHMRGDYGEAIIGNFYLEQHLKKSGSWQSISARVGRQGIDEIFIKYDIRGRPRDIIVGEIKYGSSRIGTTKNDGIQLGRLWTRKRLIELGDRYIKAARYENIRIQKRPSRLNVQQKIEVEIENGRKGIFWRENGGATWKFEGRKEDLHVAKRKAELTGRYIKKPVRMLLE